MAEASSNTTTAASTALMDTDDIDEALSNLRQMSIIAIREGKHQQRYPHA